MAVRIETFRLAETIKSEHFFAFSIMRKLRIAEPARSIFNLN